MGRRRWAWRAAMWGSARARAAWAVVVVVVVVVGLGGWPQAIRAQTLSLAEWQGDYVYSADFGRSAGGSAMGVEYTLRIRSALPQCQLELSGFQLDERLVCEARPEGRTLVVRFLGHAATGLRNHHGVTVWTPSQPLLRLRRSSDGRLLTEWLGLRGLDDLPLPNGERMRRQP